MCRARPWLLRVPSLRLRLAARAHRHRSAPRHLHHRRHSTAIAATVIAGRNPETRRVARAPTFSRAPPRVPSPPRLPASPVTCGLTCARITSEFLGCSPSSTLRSSRAETTLMPREFQSRVRPSFDRSRNCLPLDRVGREIDSPRDSERIAQARFTLSSRDDMPRRWTLINVEYLAASTCSKIADAFTSSDPSTLPRLFRAYAECHLSTSGIGTINLCKVTLLFGATGE